jgi:hypothetical protein
MLKALEKAEQTPPDELIQMVNIFKEKVARGEAHWSSSGFHGEGFSFDASEMNETQKVASMQKKAYEIEQGIYQEKEENDYIDDDDDGQRLPLAIAAGAHADTPSSSTSSSYMAGILAPDSAGFAALPPLEKAQMMVKYLATKNALPGAMQQSMQSNITSNMTTSLAGMSSSSINTPSLDAKEALARAQIIARQLTGGGVLGTDGAITQQTFTDEIEINDYPPIVRHLYLNVFTCIYVYVCMLWSCLFLFHIYIYIYFLIVSSFIFTVIVYLFFLTNLVFRRLGVK